MIADRADFEAWLELQSRPTNQPPGYEHALFMRWCSARMLAGYTVEWDYRDITPRMPVPEEAPPVPEEAPPVPEEAPPVPEEAPPLVAYTDGSGTIAERPSGAGVVVYLGSEVVLEASRHLGPGTNNHAELSAVRVALSITDTPEWSARHLTIRTDSEYTIQACTRRDDPHPAAPNARLILVLRRMLKTRTVTFEHVKGHAGIEGNVRADRLAGMARLRTTGGVLNGC